MVRGTEGRIRGTNELVVPVVLINARADLVWLTPLWIVDVEFPRIDTDDRPWNIQL